MPDEEFLVPIGKAAVLQPGRDITLISFSKPVHQLLLAAKELARENVSAEVIDLRSLRPLDEETLMASVARTGRAVVVDESWPAASVGSYVAHRIATECFDRLDAPVGFVSSEDVPMPYNHALELAVQPTVQKIVNAAKQALYLETPHG